MPKKKYHVDLTADEGSQLEGLLKSGKHNSRKLTRARILLLAAAGKNDSEIVVALSTARPTVERTRQRFVEQGLGCLDERLRPRSASAPERATASPFGCRCLH